MAIASESDPRRNSRRDPRRDPRPHRRPDVQLEPRRDNMASLRPMWHDQQNIHQTFTSTTPYAGPSVVAPLPGSSAIGTTFSGGFTRPWHVDDENLPQHIHTSQSSRRNEMELFEQVGDWISAKFPPRSGRTPSSEPENIGDGSAPFVLVHHDEPDPGKLRRRSDTRADKARKMEIQSRHGACDNCRSAKKRCDGNSPCGRCSEKNLECSRGDDRLGTSRKRTSVHGRAESEPAASAREPEEVPPIPSFDIRMDVDERPLEPREAPS